MTKSVIYEAKWERNGPFLLTQEQLFSLDEVIESIVSDYNSNVSSDDKSNLGKHKATKSLSIRAKDKYFPDYSSFGEAALDPQFDILPDTFEYKIEIGEGIWPSSLTLKANVNSYNSFSLEGRPNNDPKIQRAFSKLKMWVEENKPSLLLQTWSSSGLFIGLFLVFGIELLILQIGSFRSGPSELAVAIKDLVAKGVNQEEMPNAIQLLLRHASGEAMFAKVNMTESATFKKFLFFCDILGLISLIRPTEGIFDVKRKSKKLFFWSYWIKLIVLSIPFMVAGFIGNRILEFIFNN